LEGSSLKGAEVLSISLGSLGVDYHRRLIRIILDFILPFDYLFNHFISAFLASTPFYVEGPIALEDRGQHRDLLHLALHSKRREEGHADKDEVIVNTLVRSTDHRRYSVR